jgi:hypothetical protein
MGRTFDLTGQEPYAMKQMKIDLTLFGVVGEDLKDLQPADNPHTVSEEFGRDLIRSGRAREHDPEKLKQEQADKKGSAGKVENRDPKVTDRDPKAKK